LEKRSERFFGRPPPLAEISEEDGLRSLTFFFFSFLTKPPPTHSQKKYPSPPNQKNIFLVFPPAESYFDPSPLIGGTSSWCANAGKVTMRDEDRANFLFPFPLVSGYIQTPFSAGDSVSPQEQVSRSSFENVFFFFFPGCSARAPFLRERRSVGSPPFSPRRQELGSWKRLSF